DAARTEKSRDPMIWWNLLAAFTFLLALVLSANIFADAVQEAFDPRMRRFRPRRRGARLGRRPLAGGLPDVSAARPAGAAERREGVRARMTYYPPRGQSRKWNPAPRHALMGDRCSRCAG